MRRVFRDFCVLLVANPLSLKTFQELMGGLPFKAVETLDDDRQALDRMKTLKPDLVVVTRHVKVFSGMQLLSAARQGKGLEQLPFLILGDKKDTRPGGLAEQVRKSPPAMLIGTEGLTAEQLDTALTELLDPIIDPKKEQSYGLLDDAQDAAKADDLRTAVAKMRQADTLSPLDSDNTAILAGYLGRLGMYQEAEDAFLAALSKNPENLKAYFSLADLHESNGELDLATQVLHEALNLARSLKGSNQSMARLNFYVGEFELRLKRLSDAAASFDRAIAATPEDAELRSQIGDAYAEKGYFAESEEHYRSALEMNPFQAHVLNRLGIAYRRQKKYTKALDLYLNAQKHAMEDEHLLFNIARVHFEQENYDYARDLLEKALQLDPEFREARWLLGKIPDTVRMRVELDDSFD